MINGLTYIDDIITPEQETELINFIDIQEWNNSLSRRTQHYGYLYVYNYFKQ
jgi:alkylated DNA repair protein alkB family protein 8